MSLAQILTFPRHLDHNSVPPSYGKVLNTGILLLKEILRQEASVTYVSAYTKKVETVSPLNPVPRQVRLFRNNRNQAIRIPVEFELPGSEAIISRDGDRLIIQPVCKGNLLELLASWEPLDEAFPDVDATLQTLGDVTL